MEWGTPFFLPDRWRGLEGRLLFLSWAPPPLRAGAPSFCLFRYSRLAVALPPSWFLPKKPRKRCLQMKNYWASDYALNRKSAGIVYRFADGVVEITLEDYIRENPDKTEEDFRKLKEISDELYADQERKQHTSTYLDIPLHCCKGVCTPSAEEVWEQMLTRRELEKLRACLERFLQSSLLTEIQRRRFSLYCIEAASTRQIAGAEGVSQCSVWECLHACQKKFKNFLRNYPVTPPDFLH